MVKVPKIAVFRGEEGEYTTLMSVFSRHTYTVRTINSVRELGGIAEHDGCPCDVVIFGIQSLSNTVRGLSERPQSDNAQSETSEKGIAIASELPASPSLILELKAHPSLSTTPVVVLFQGSDRSAIQTLYGAGADCVIRSPFDPELVYLQVSALARRSRAHSKSLRAQGDALSFHSPLLWALNCAREGILVFDSSKEALFANQSARILLGLDTPESLSTIGPQFAEFIKPSTSSQSFSQFSAPARVTSIARSNGQRFIAHLRCIPLHGESGSVVGYAVGVQDASERGDLSTLLSHAKRVQSVALLSFGGALNWLRLATKRSSLNPFEELHSQLKLEARFAEYGGVILVLLELLDAILNPGIELSVEYEKDFAVAVRFTDLLQILGSMVFEAIEHAGSVGDATIRADLDATTATIVVSSESRRVTPYLPDDFMSALLQGTYQVDIAQRSQTGSSQTGSSQTGSSQKESSERDGEPFPTGLLEAQKVADGYGASIDYKRADSMLKMRLRLPLVPTAKDS